MKGFLSPTVSLSCDGCSYRCESLRHVTLGSSSSLERIGNCCFGGSRLVGLKIPPSVTHITKSTFSVRPHIFVATIQGKKHTLECELTDKIKLIFVLRNAPAQIRSTLEDAPNLTVWRCLHKENHPSPTSTTLSGIGKDSMLVLEKASRQRRST